MKHCVGLYTLVLLTATLLCATLVKAEIVYQGCWASASNLLRAMPFRAAANEYMTADFCRRLAINRQTLAFGLEWGRECWLDTGSGDLASITRFGASNNCTMPCLGNPTQRCGGDFTADMYTVTDQLPASIPERNTTFLGCFRDDQLDRRMTLLWESNNSMSIDLCAHIAYAEEWSVFATQWGRECWGSKDLNYTMSLGASMSCDMPCPGNANQTCGGALALDVYEVTDKYWDVPEYESPWDAPKPAPAPASANLLTATDKGATPSLAAQSGAAAAAAAAAAAGALNKLAVTAVVLLGCLMMH